MNPICAATGAQVAPLLQSFARKAKKAGEDKFSFKAFTRLAKRVAAIQQAGVTQIQAVPPYPGDESLVDTWLQNRRTIFRLRAKLADLFGQLFTILFRFEALYTIDDALGLALGVQSCALNEDSLFSAPARTRAAYARLLAAR